MRLLILDDEPILRQGIVNKIKQSGLPIEIAGEAGDGIAGLELIRQGAPDIVVTDIRMPGMDGIAFIEQAKRLDEQLHFVIISGYSDFDYAKRAIQLGVFDYLLKPVEDDELIGILTKIMTKIEQRRIRREELARLRDETNVSRETLRQHYMTKMLQQAELQVGGPEERDEQLSRLESRYSYFMAIVLVFEPIRLPHGSFREGDEDLIWFAVENVMSERMEAAGRGGVLFQHVLLEHEMVYLLGIDSPNESLAVQDWLGEVLYGLQTYLKLQVTIAIGGIVDQIGQIPQSYKQAKLAIRNKIIRGTGHIYDYESLHKRSADRGVLLTGEDESKLFFWLNEHNAGALQGWIEQRIRTLTEAPAATCMQLEWFCADLYLLFRKYLIANTKVTDWIIGEMDDLLLWLQNLTVWQDAVVQMQHIAVNIIGYLSQINPAKDVMEEVKSYLDLHYGESITLQSISEKFYIHPNYFSRRFKEKYGQSFVDYLTALRMKTALDWLRETDVKIQDIANKVGFEDASYFSNVFRKFYGVTPKQYREQNS